MPDAKTANPPDLPPREGDAEAEALLAAGLSSPSTGGRSPPPAPADVQDRFPDYEILEVIGQGGMGVVYKARHRRLDRLVALKVLPEAMSADPAFAERFAREARTLARLQHPHIVGVHDFGTAGPQHYLVMEYVDGVNLRQLMSSGELTPREALAIVPQICDALQYAHDEGVVHRDIKPENVLLDRSGNVKVADFGLAKLLQHGPGEMTLTGTDQVMGTVHYMAPEQYKSPQAVDHRADIFSLGVVFYEMLTGELPVGRFEKPSEVKDLDARIDDIVMHALERERDQRYQKAREVRTDVDTVLGTAPADSEEGRTGGALGQVGRHDHEWSTRDAGGGRRMSRWAIGALLSLPITLALALLAYGFVEVIAGPAEARQYRAMIAWWVALGGSLAALLVSITAMFVTHGRRAVVRGQGAALLALVLALGGTAGTLAGLSDEVRSMAFRARYGRGDPSPLPMPSNRSIEVIGAGSESREREVAAALTELLEAWKRAAREAVPSLETMRRAGLYTPEDIGRLEDMTEEDRAAAADRLALGLGFLSRKDLTTYLPGYRITRVVMSPGGGNVYVTATPMPWTFNAAGTVTFPVKQTPTGWAFEIGPVIIR